MRLFSGKAVQRTSTGFSLIGAFALIVLVVGCASPQQTESLLSEAGFNVIAPPQQQQLRPYKVTAAERNGETYYLYMDPARNQLYVGNRAQYQRYRQLKRELEAAQQSYNPPVFD